MPLAILRERPENTRARTGVAGVETPSSRRIRLVMQRKRERGREGGRERRRLVLRDPRTSRNPGESNWLKVRSFLSSDDEEIGDANETSS